VSQTDLEFEFVCKCEEHAKVPKWGWQRWSTEEGDDDEGDDDEGDDDEGDDDEGDDDEGDGDEGDDDEGDDEDDVMKAATWTAERVIDAERWEDGPIERARRIWGWWKARLKGVSFFKHWPLALLGLSSSSLEILRGAGLLTNQDLIEQIGVSSLEETTEARTMVRCNGFTK
jgi:hypothetical protein